MFSDGHATKKFTAIYDDPTHLNELDWPLMDEIYWSDTDEDNDRSRRRQAEFLVHGSFPWEAIEYLAVKDANMKRRLGEYLQERWPRMIRPVKSRPGWYF